jgi:ubiquinone/menaquinone biosynthesis C-methylase UbiE
MTAMSRPDPYFLGYSKDEQVRLERQAQEFALDSQWLFDNVGIGDGSRVIEIGCGPRGCLDLLSKRVGPTGSVIGLERNAEQVERAQRFVTDNRLTNVKVMHGDARATGFPDAAFDVATARLVLVNVPNPEQIVVEMARVVRPGGIVVLHEADCIGHQMCDPPLPAWTRLFQLLNTYAEMNGIDRFVGRKVPRMLREAGLVDVRVNPVLHVYPPRQERRMVLFEFVENVRDRLLSANLISKRELDESTAALKRYVQDPRTEIFSAILIQAWGRTSDG